MAVRDGTVPASFPTGMALALALGLWPWRWPWPWSVGLGLGLECSGLVNITGYGVSLAVWDHTKLPATRHKWTHPARGRYSFYLPL